MTLNSPQLLSKKYMPWRILRASGAWASAYMKRARSLRTYKSALVFPEQLLALKEANLFQVFYANDNSNKDPNRPTSEVSVVIKRLSNCRLCLKNGNTMRALTSVDEVYEAEDRNDSSADLGQFHIKMGLNGGEGGEFLNYYLFSSKRDALAYAKSKLNLLSN